MLTCITCSKQRIEGEDEDSRGTPSTKDAVQSLTTQVLTPTHTTPPRLKNLYTAVSITPPIYA